MATGLSFSCCDKTILVTEFFNSQNISSTLYFVVLLILHSFIVILHVIVQYRAEKWPWMLCIDGDRHFKQVSTDSFNRPTMVC